MFYTSKLIGMEYLYKNHLHNGWFFSFSSDTQRDLTPNSNHPNGGVCGGTIRLLPVDSKPRQHSKLRTSHPRPVQTRPKLK